MTRAPSTIFVPTVMRDRVAWLCRRLGVDYAEVSGTRRTVTVMRARWIMGWCLRHWPAHVRLSWKQIAAMFGHSHSAMLAGSRCVEADPALLATARSILAQGSVKDAAMLRFTRTGEHRPAAALVEAACGRV